MRVAKAARKIWQRAAVGRHPFGARGESRQPRGKYGGERPWAATAYYELPSPVLRSMRFRQHWRMASLPEKRKTFFLVRVMAV